jgi:hypothetical protein
MAETSVYREVREYISAKISRGEVVMVDWLTHEIVANKSDIEGGDVEFYRVCAFTHVRDVVKRCVGKYDAKPKTEDQLVLDGFSHLQVAYSVERAGQTVLVPVDQLSDAEIDLRAAEYDKMARGCEEHAEELRSYKHSRSQVAA